MVELTRLSGGLSLSPEGAIQPLGTPFGTGLMLVGEHGRGGSKLASPHAPANPPALSSEKRGPGALAGPGHSPYPKSGLPSWAFTEGFRWQGRAIDCEPTQVFNLLSELSRRHCDPSIKLGYETVVQILPPMLEGVAWNRAIKSLDRRVPANYQVRYSMGSSSRWADVERVLADEEASLPLIGVSQGYWREVSNSQAAVGGTDHALLVLSTNSERVEVFDSYIAILNRSTRSRSRRSRLTMADGIVSVSPVRLISYWEQAGIPRHLFWVQRRGKRLTQRLLTEQWESQ